MMRAVNRAFQLRPKAVNGVGVAATAHVLFAPVVHLLVFVTERADVVVSRVFVGMQGCTRFHGIADMADDVRGVHGSYNLRGDTAPAIYDANYGSLASRTPPALAGAFTANVGFIRLAFAKEFGRLFIHQFADFMGHAPSRLIGHAKLPLQFLRRNPVPAGGHQEDGKEPRNEACSRFVEDGASRRINLETAPRTAVGTTFLNRIKAVFLTALRARSALRKTSLEQEIEASAVIRKIVLKFS